ncbi:cyanophycin synthetase [Proteobacteria bacterium 005FR1]|nr:cyanophycin synthetase [Proteobacteria bacterium 005FR1]
MADAAVLPNKISGLEGRLLDLRYKMAKLQKLLPSRAKHQSSDFEDRNFRARFYNRLWRESAAGIGFDYRELGYGFWAISDPSGNEVRGRGGIVDLDSNVALYLAGNKPVSHRLLQGIEGYRAPRFQEFRLASIGKAINFLNEQQRPCVIKPARDTGAGAGVITGIADENALRQAAIAASVHCKDLLIEETVEGSSYRLLFLGGKYLHGIRRDPPTVVADGQSTIRELIETENQRRYDQGEQIVSLFTIEIDQDCRATLQEQGYDLASRPAAGKTVIIKRVVNQNAAKDNVEVTNHVHPSIIATGIQASAELGLQLSGVDVLTSDISRPLDETGGVINEINGTPGLHHHYLTVSGRDPDITGRLLRYCMATASRPHAL